MSTRRRSTSRLAFSRFPALVLGATLLTSLACASGGAVASSRNAQLLAPPKDPCVLAREDAALDPRLDVEKVPAPVAMKPAPIRQPVPRSVMGRNRRSVIRVEVMVDTLGKPDMTTFNVIESSHEWFTTGARRAIAKWTFTPAERNGCKVARYYQFSARSGVN
ncbi:MAG TPA: energy transducer TonB [Gemmatimonadaceae bacterium]|nr:energy transducer TonB [Gemmatimonadaceae bacterium]